MPKPNAIDDPTMMGTNESIWNVVCAVFSASAHIALYLLVCLSSLLGIDLKIHLNQHWERVERTISEFGAVVCHIVSVVVRLPSDRHTFEYFFSSSAFSRYQTSNRFHCAFFNNVLFPREHFKCVKSRSICNSNNFSQIFTVLNGFLMCFKNFIVFMYILRKFVLKSASNKSEINKNRKQTFSFWFAQLFRFSVKICDIRELNLKFELKQFDYTNSDKIISE